MYRSPATCTCTYTSWLLAHCQTLAVTSTWTRAAEKNISAHVLCTWTIPDDQSQVIHNATKWICISRPIPAYWNDFRVVVSHLHPYGPYKIGSFENYPLRVSVTAGRNHVKPSASLVVAWWEDVIKRGVHWTGRRLVSPRNRFLSTISNHTKTSHAYSLFKTTEVFGLEEQVVTKVAKGKELQPIINSFEIK